MPKTTKVCIFSRSNAQFEIINVYLLKSNFHTYLFLQAPNALLRCEQRNTDATAYYLNHLNQRMMKMPRVANHS
ncbi:hypothetical protein D018_5119 [Vibrio parahaemolyticus VP2007-007]|nr:hypothetical protein D018_5119 [Vibrio parahaemolyticus VP2007-007]